MADEQRKPVCKTCAGKGIVTSTDVEGDVGSSPPHPNEMACPACRGTGVADSTAEPLPPSKP